MRGDRALAREDDRPLHGERGFEQVGDCRDVIGSGAVTSRA